MLPRRRARRAKAALYTGLRQSRRSLRPVGALDRRITEGVGDLPPGRVDDALLHLTRSANHSGLWFATASVLAALGTRRTRRGALRGVFAIGLASFASNALLKPLVPRRRPAAELLPPYRSLPDRPTSSSFPSGHSASAFAFAVGVGLESPRAGAVLAPLAATVAYSRVHVGVHWTSDVAVGSAIGAGAALLTQRWLPRRPVDEAIARPWLDAPVLAEGEGLSMVVNMGSGRPGVDPAEEIAASLPRAEIVRLEQGDDLLARLQEAAALPGTRALGIAGGDGSVAAAARIAEDLRLPLAVMPAGTLNHFGRDVGVYDLQEVVDATGAGEAVAVDVGELRAYSASTGPAGGERQVFVNTASFGGYPDMVRLREKWEKRYGKWPAASAALVAVLWTARPVRCRIDGRETSVWMLFVGNGPYAPSGMTPAYRPRLDSGLLEVRYLRADRRFSRARAIVGLLLGTLGHIRTYVEHTAKTLDVELLDGPLQVATDGEVMVSGERLCFSVADHPVPVYRRDETRWPERTSAW
ncbi:bifunctional phosphatase PAP2/diacylglycerol kinase family protein [Actinomycetospora termitidis]|uniref:Phosphatase PAP2 family protein n=1 Tax=Actinomycetospora termitidis TaxID=3053470 RepID=A0ABT7MFN2_9PSEU|nr:bifunctional phosphatase PAP2/diacylglycerol kinase family protein [Actinomycetospora sp. Odt1-22]MDL5158173.1 phosphatase PAP2 family protein [Actinomycetospora sp. Odt1-22]